jgi:hypothetical protein
MALVDSSSHDRVFRVERIDKRPYHYICKKCYTIQDDTYDVLHGVLFNSSTRITMECGKTSICSKCTRTFLNKLCNSVVRSHTVLLVQ